MRRFIRGRIETVLEIFKKGVAFKVRIADIFALSDKDRIRQKVNNDSFRGVAQSGSAVALGAIGREFESLRPDHF